MRLFLDSTTRAFRGQAPEGASTLGPELTTDTVVVNVPDQDWYDTLYPAWQAAYAAGKDLVVAVDGSTSQAVHVLSSKEQVESVRKAALRAFVNHPSPPAAVQEAAMRALIQHLGLDV